MSGGVGGKNGGGSVWKKERKGGVKGEVSGRNGKKETGPGGEKEWDETD